MALQLSGLQCQVSLGDPQPGKTEFYADVHSYLPPRIAQSQKSADWVNSPDRKTEIFMCIYLIACIDCDFG